MRQVMVRYKVKPGQGQRNEELARRVYDELREKAPADLRRYATFALEDGVSFVHLAEVDAEDERNPLMEIAAFRDFTEHIAERCEEPPAPVNLRQIGSYHFQSE
jgi:hypothetical protein